jgi:hypothetical protein
VTNVVRRNRCYDARANQLSLCAYENGSQAGHTLAPSHLLSNLPRAPSRDTPPVIAFPQRFTSSRSSYHCLSFVKSFLPAMCAKRLSGKPKRCYALFKTGHVTLPRQLLCDALCAAAVLLKRHGRRERPQVVAGASAGLPFRPQPVPVNFSDRTIQCPSW